MESIHCMSSFMHVTRVSVTDTNLFFKSGIVVLPVWPEIESRFDYFILKLWVYCLTQDTVKICSRLVFVVIVF